MAIKLILIFSFCALFSCQNTTDTKSNEKNNLKKDSVKAIAKPSNDFSNHVTKKKTSKYNDSTWVFQKLKDNAYSFNTELSNGYRLKHKVFKDPEYDGYLQSLMLMNGEKVIAEVGGGSFGLSHKNIGYIGADFDKSFVLVHSYGSGNPSDFELIQKKSGKILRKGTWVDANEAEQILLYIKGEFTKDQKLIIYDIKNNVEIISTGFEKYK